MPRRMWDSPPSHASARAAPKLAGEIWRTAVEGGARGGEICGGSCEVRLELPMRGREKGDKDRLVLVLGKQREIGKNGATSKEGGSVLAQLK